MKVVMSDQVSINIKGKLTDANFKFHMAVAKLTKNQFILYILFPSPDKWHKGITLHISWSKFRFVKQTTMTAVCFIIW